MAAYPKDRFDQLPEDLVRVGAHRGPKRKGGGWIGLAWALLAVIVLTVGGGFVLSRFFDIDLGISLFEPPPVVTPTPTPTPTAEPLTDPTTIPAERLATLKINLLNGTAIVGLQTTVADSLRAEGWTIASALPSSAKDVEETFVYYSDPADEDIARGLALALGVGQIRTVPIETFPEAKITIVIGADYPVPTPAAG